MNTNQAKASVETAKEVMNDKTLKTKGDKDRRLREKKQQNTKKFMEERKTVQIKQGREKEKLKVTHEKQVTDLDKDIEMVSDHMYVWFPSKIDLLLNTRICKYSKQIREEQLVHSYGQSYRHSIGKITVMRYLYNERIIKITIQCSNK